MVTFQLSDFLKRSCISTSHFEDLPSGFTTSESASAQSSDTDVSQRTNENENENGEVFDYEV